MFCADENIILELTAEQLKHYFPFPFVHDTPKIEIATILSVELLDDSYHVHTILVALSTALFFQVKIHLKISVVRNLNRQLANKSWWNRSVNYGEKLLSFHLKVLEQHDDF